MDCLRDFKSAADEVMENINISNELKEKTLMNCKKKKNRFINTTFVPAACIVILFISLSFWRLTLKERHFSSEISNTNVKNANLMNTQDNATLPITSDGKELSSQRTTVSTNLKSIDEAKEYIGNIVLIPSFLPSEFKINGIQAVSYDDDKRRTVWIEYVFEGKSFGVNVEQESQWKSFEGYKNVDINGLVGHIKSFKDSSNEITELRWFSGTHLYTVEGEIPEEAAIKVARSLK